MSQKVTGKAGYFQFGGTKIAFQKISHSADRTLADTTDSDDYDPQTDMIYPSQIPVKVGTKLDVEGRFNLSTTIAQLMSKLYSGASALPTVIGINANVQAGSGNFDLSNFSMDEPVDDVITWKASLQSNGKFTPGGTSS